jgi:ubiquinone/menaquinone biosynthesis C-methylase UbiE
MRQATPAKEMTSMDPDEWRRFVLEVAKAGAPGWERWRARIEEGAAPMRRWLIEQLAPDPGETVLELAAGAGDTGLEAAAIVGERGRLISSDVSPEMVDVARRRGSELELRNVEYRVLDAERLDLDAQSVDAVLCRCGYMLMADPEAALAETHRVLRAGGRIALSVWSNPERNPWASVLGRQLVELGHMEPPGEGDPSPFGMADEGGTRARLDAAGFTSVRTDEVPVRFVFDGLADYLRCASDTAGPAVLVLRQLSQDELAKLEERLEGAFASFATDGGYALPGVALAAAATRR